MKKIALLTPLLLLTFLLNAQDLTGSWYGTLDISGKKLRVIFHVKSSPQGYHTTMDSPDQGAKGLPTDKTTITDKNIQIEAAQFQMSYKGAYVDSTDQIKGIFKQGAGNLPLTLSRKEPVAEIAKPLVRPQDPTDFPYKQEEVSFVNPKGGHKLSGTLTMPSNGKVSKIAILISGSGPQDRNEEIVQYNHRPFLVWSDWLTRNGIAVLRYDDRGVGKSDGVFHTATSADFADDADAAVAYIKSRGDLKGLSVGLLGHSEGGMIAPMVASKNPAVQFIVLLAAPGIPIPKLMVQQTRDQSRLSGVPESTIDTNAALTEKIYHAINTYKDLAPQDFKAKLDTFLYTALRNMKEMAPASIPQQVDALSAQFRTPWFTYFLSVDPGLYLSKIKCPVLAINGSLDMQVAGEPNLNGIKESLTRAGNKHFEVVSLPGLNHLLQKAETGSVSEYGESSETVNQAALQKVSDWIKKL